MRIRPGYVMGAKKYVWDGDKVYVGEAAIDPQGHDLGAAVWSASFALGGPFHPVQAANEVAQAIAQNPDGVAADPSPAAVEAAAGCVAKHG